MLQGTLIAILVAIVTGGWSRANYKRKPHEASEASGNITPGKISAAIVTLFGVVFSVFGVAGLAYGQPMLGLLLLLPGVALTIFMSPSLTHVHDLAWDEDGVDGPCQRFGPSLGLSRTRIQWDDVVATGRTTTDYWFIQSKDARRIYWSYLYPGYGKFVETLQARRPHLSLPPGLD